MKTSVRVEKDLAPPAVHPPAAETTCDTEPSDERLKTFVVRSPLEPGTLNACCTLAYLSVHRPGTSSICQTPPVPCPSHDRSPESTASTRASPATANGQRPTEQRATANGLRNNGQRGTSNGQRNNGQRATEQRATANGLRCEHAAAELPCTPVQRFRTRTVRNSQPVRLSGAVGGLLVVREGGHRGLKARGGGVP